MRYGRWSVLQQPKHGEFWFCECACGVKKKVRKYYLLDGRSTSCGCWKNEKISLRNYRHGAIKTPTYKSWSGMLDRCRNKSTPCYKNYGARGIKVCKRWYKFNLFLKDMGHRPDGMTIERIDNDKGYYPKNCKWATAKEQNNNTRQNRYLNYHGENLTVMQWSEKLNLNYGTLRSRLGKLGWTIQEALVPVKFKASGEPII